jgi:hypothetical protein
LPFNIPALGRVEEHVLENFLRGCDVLGLDEDGEGAEGEDVEGELDDEDVEGDVEGELDDEDVEGDVEGELDDELAEDFLVISAPRNVCF